MKSTFAILAALFFVTAPARAGGAVASDWVDFREARIRLVMERSGGNQMQAGLEIAMVPGYKTYWRNVGDSGVPPHFDFARSAGLADFAVSFPFPETFDDGAGGRAIGYKMNVILPIAARITGPSPVLHLKLDFAVCGTLCIPLSGEITLDPARGAPLPSGDAKRLTAARATLPRPVTNDTDITISRIAETRPARWRIHFPYTGDLGRFTAFAEAKGFAEIAGIDHRSDGTAHLVVSVDKAAGADSFGLLRLTYGNKEEAFERVVDLDAAPVTP